MATVPTTNPAPIYWTRRHSVGCLSTVLFMVIVGLLHAPMVVSWMFYFGLMTLFTIIAADGITGNKCGILIDERNMMTLSRLQMAIWTVLIISAFLAAAIGNVRAGVANPLNIVIPQPVWLLMGISMTALVGTPLILSAKRATPTTAVPPTPGAAINPAESGVTPVAPVAAHTRQALPASFAAVLRAQGEDPSRLWRDGSVVERMSIYDAAWSDLFKGDEVSNVATLDLSKIQMFFFTFIVAVTYAVALGYEFQKADDARANGRGNAPAPPKDPRRVDEFPPLDTGIVTLMGISNAGCLINKAIPRSQPG